MNSRFCRQSTYHPKSKTCEMNASMECEKCRLKVQEVLINVYGAYSMNIDAQQGTVKVSGRVNPKIILQILLGGKHGKIKNIKFEGEEPSMGSGYPPHPLPPYGMGGYRRHPPHPPYGMGPYPSYPSYSYPGPHNYPMMMPQPLMLPPPPSPPSAAPAPAEPQKQQTLLLEAPPQNSGAASQPQNSGMSAPPATNLAKEAVAVTPSSDKKSKRRGDKNCSIM